MLFSLAARHRDNGAAQTLSTIVRAQAACEQTVAIRDVHHVTGPPACCTNRACHQISPAQDVVCGVAHHRWFAGGARRRMNAHDPALRHSKHAKGVVGAQVFFGGEREFADISQHLEISRVNACCAKRQALVRHVLVDVVKRGFQALGLQRDYFIPAGLFKGVEQVVRCRVDTACAVGDLST